MHIKNNFFKTISVIRSNVFFNLNLDKGKSLRILGKIGVRGNAQPHIEHKYFILSRIAKIFVQPDIR